MLINPIVKSEFLFEKAPFASCHASTIAETRDGKLVCAWFGGSHEGANDVGIYLSRNDGSKWTEPVEVADGHDDSGRAVPCWNPVLFQVSPGRLLLFYKIGKSIQHWKGWFKASLDDGITWTAGQALPDGILGPVKNKPIELRGGRILSGSSQESGGWRVHFEFSDDGAKTWSKTRDANSPGVIAAIQPALLEQGNGAVIAIGRTQQRKLFYIKSLDRGATWGKMDLLNVDNPNSGIDAARLSSGDFILIYNNSTSKRTPLNLAISGDGCRWKPIWTLEGSPGEFSYPAIIQTRDRLIHVTYTWNRVRIKHVVIDPDKLVLVK